MQSITLPTLALCRKAAIVNYSFETSIGTAKSVFAALWFLANHLQFPLKLQGSNFQWDLQEIG